MARLFSSGFELNDLTSGVEITSSTGAADSIVTTPVRSGTYSYRVAPGANIGYVLYVFKSVNTADGFFFRFYIYIAGTPANQNDIFQVLQDNGNNKVEIKINTDRTLELWNAEDNAQVGSDSSALSLNTWYRIELKVDCTTISSTAIEGKIDGTSFASGTINLANGISTLVFGLVEAATADLFFDDIAINDDSGSFQNSYPGEGSIIHLRPSGIG